MECFQQGAPMFFGKEFANKTTDIAEAIKAIKKISYQKPGEKNLGHFLGYHPQNQADYNTIPIFNNFQFVQ